MFDSQPHYAHFDILFLQYLDNFLHRGLGAVLISLSFYPPADELSNQARNLLFIQPNLRPRVPSLTVPTLHRTHLAPCPPCTVPTLHRNYRLLIPPFLYRNLSFFLNRTVSLLNRTVSPLNRTVSLLSRTSSLRPLYCDLKLRLLLRLSLQLFMRLVSRPFLLFFLTEISSSAFRPTHKLFIR